MGNSGKLKADHFFEDEDELVHVLPAKIKISIKAGTALTILEDNGDNEKGFTFKNMRTDEYYDREAGFYITNINLINHFKNNGDGLIPIMTPDEELAHVQWQQIDGEDIKATIREQLSS